MRRITHNAHVFIIRPFVQLFRCSLVLFCFCCVFFSSFLSFGVLLFCFSLGLLSFFTLLSLYSAFALSYYFYYFDSVTFVGLVYLLLPISFLFRNVVVFSVLLFFLCYFTLAPLLFFSFPFLFFSLLDLLSIQVYSLRFAAHFRSVFHSSSLQSHFSFSSHNYLYAADVDWPFPLGISRPTVQSTQDWCEMLTMPSTDECITFFCHTQTHTPSNKRKCQ